MWDEVFLRFDWSLSNDHLKYFRDVFLPRIKKRRCNVTITAINAHTVQAKFEACGVSTLPSIRRLVLNFATPQHLIDVMSEQHIVFTCKLGTVQITHEEGRFGIPPSIDVISLLPCMPQLYRLVINRVSYLEFPTGCKSETLTSITLTNTTSINLSKLMAALPNLEMLHIRNSAIQIGDIQDPLEHASIRTLNLANIKTTEWMTHVAFTQLTNLVYDGYMTDIFTSFVANHRSLKSIAYKGQSNRLSSLADIAPQLTELTTRLPLPAFLQNAGSGSNMPFPQLESLIVDMTLPSAQLTVGEFETLIRTKCLPIGHPKCLATHSAHIIPSISFAGIKPSSNPQWFGSGLYQESFRSGYRTSLYNYDLLRLSWPQYS